MPVRGEHCASREWCRRAVVRLTRLCAPEGEGMKRTVIVSSIIIGMIAAALVVRFRESGKHTIPDVITVGIATDFPPYAYRDYSCSIDAKKPSELVMCPKHPQAIGFDYDLIAELGKKLGKQMVLKELPFEALFLTLELNQIDMIVSGLSVTPERARRALWSDPYVESNPFVLIVPKDSSIMQLADIAGKTVLVVQDRVSPAQYESAKPGRVISVPTLEIALSTLAVEGDGIIAEINSLAPYREYWERQDIRLVLVPDLHIPVAIGIQSQMVGLRDIINKGLRALEHDGTLAQLRKKWGLV